MTLSTSLEKQAERLQQSVWLKHQWTAEPPGGLVKSPLLATPHLEFLILSGQGGT